jgi:hypothetical protein
MVDFELMQACEEDTMSPDEPEMFSIFAVNPSVANKDASSIAGSFPANQTSWQPSARDNSGEQWWILS